MSGSTTCCAGKCFTAESVKSKKRCDFVAFVHVNALIVADFKFVMFLNRVLKRGMVAHRYRGFLPDRGIGCVMSIGNDKM